MKVGFIGVGTMGAGMALNVRKAGHELTVYNRTGARAEKWLAESSASRKSAQNSAVAVVS